MVFISDTIQKVEDMQRHRTVPSAEVLKFLSNINIDHVIPSKPLITARRFMVCPSTFIDIAKAYLDCSGRMLHWFGSHP
jgi:hypothetical protein